MEREAYRGPVESQDINGGHLPRHSQRTSRSNSSGPTRGSKIAGSTSTPDASLVEGGTTARSVSGRSMALWAGTWNAQFLSTLRLTQFEGGNSPHTHLIVESTPPLLILSLCSVNTMTFANGYSRGESCCNGFEGNGVKKKFRPVWDCASVSDKLSGANFQANHSDICKDASQEV